MNGAEAPTHAVVGFALDVFSLESVKRAAYRLTADYAFDFAVADREVICVVSSLRFPAQETPDDFAARFRNEVLDQDLRERIATETGAVRNAVLAYAFSNTGLQNVE